MEKRHICLLKEEPLFISNSVLAEENMQQLKFFNIQYWVCAQQFITSSLLMVRKKSGVLKWKKKRKINIIFQQEWLGKMF